MKTGWKVFWIICAVLGGIGCVLVIAGLTLGANVSTIQSAFEDQIHNVSQDIYKYTEGDVQVTPDMSADYKGITELSVSVSDCEVIVQSVDATDGVIRLDTSRLDRNIDLTVKQDGNELEIENDNHHITGHKNNGQLYIFVPTSGSLTKADFEVGAGTLSIDSITARELDITVGAGIADVGACTTDYLDVECGTGEVNVNLAGAKKEYNYQLECAMGEIAIGDDSYAGLAVEQKINNSAAKNVKIECGVGQVNIGYESGV